MKRAHREITDLCIELSGIPEDILLSKTRVKTIWAARVVLCKVLYEETGTTLKEVGHSLAYEGKDRDHTSILDAVRKANKIIEQDLYGAKKLYMNMLDRIDKIRSKNKLIIYYPDDFNIHSIIKRINQIPNKQIKYQLA